MYSFCLSNYPLQLKDILIVVSEIFTEADLTKWRTSSMPAGFYSLSDSID